MTQPGRSCFDAEVALATAPARLPLPPAPVPPLVPRWRRIGSRLKQFMRRLLRPRPGDAPAQPQPQPDLCALCEALRQQSREQHDILLQEMDALRTELRLVYNGVLDEIQAARRATGQEHATLQDGREAGPQSHSREGKT